MSEQSLIAEEFDTDHGFVISVGKSKYLGRRDLVVNKQAAFIFVNRGVADARREKLVETFPEAKVIRVKGIPTIMRNQGDWDSHNWTIEKGGTEMPLKKKSTGKEKSQAAKPKAEAKAKAKEAPERKRREKKEWKKGDVTPAGCTIHKVTHDPKAAGGHTTVLTVKCIESGKLFDIFSQDAHQTKYHPSIRDEMKRRDRREKRAKSKGTAMTAKA